MKYKILIRCWFIIKKVPEILFQNSRLFIVVVVGHVILLYFPSLVFIFDIGVFYLKCGNHN